METIYYEKRGRRYHPVSIYDSNLSSAYTKGAHLVVVDEHVRSTLHHIDPANAEVLAAVKKYQEDLVQAAHKAMEMQPGPPHQKVAFTKKQQAAWEAFVATFPKGTSPHHAHFKSLLSVFEAASEKLLERVAEERSKLKGTTKEQILERYKDDVHPEALLWDGFEDAIIGVGTRCGQMDVFVYSWEKCVNILMVRDGMDRLSAAEYIDFNVTGGWLGEGTPIMLTSEYP